MIESVLRCRLVGVDDSPITPDGDGLYPAPLDTLALNDPTAHPVNPPTNPGGFFIET